MTALSQELIRALSGLGFPSIHCTAEEQDPTTTSGPRLLSSALPKTFTHDASLVATLDSFLRNYLLEYPSWTISPSDLVGSKIEYAKRAAYIVEVESELRLQSIFESSLFAAVNETIWMNTRRNKGVMTRSYGAVGPRQAGQPDLDLRERPNVLIKSRRLLGIEVKPSNTVSEAAVATIIDLVKEDAVELKPSGLYQLKEGMLATFGHRPYVPALKVLNQIALQFTESPIAWDILLTPEVAVIFNLRPTSIALSDIIWRNGSVTQEVLCSNFYTLFLALAILPLEMLLPPKPDSPESQPKSAARASTHNDASNASFSSVGGTSCPTSAAPSRQLGMPSTQSASSLSAADHCDIFLAGNRTPPGTESWSSPSSSPETAGRSAIIDLSQIGASPMLLRSDSADETYGVAHNGAIFTRHLQDLLFWGPLSLDLFTNHVAPSIKISNATIPSDSAGSVVLRVIDRVGQGGVWNAFTTASTGGKTATDVPSSAPSVPPTSCSHPYPAGILKVTCIDKFLDRAYYNRVNNGNYSDMLEIAYRKHVAMEIVALDRLAGLSCAPNLLGVWAGIKNGEQYWAVLTSHAGRRVAPNDDAAALLPSVVKQRILDSYAAIHSRGIFHGDPKAVHWCVPASLPTTEPLADTPITIIDFSHSEDVSSVSEESREGMLLNEICAVRYILGAPIVPILRLADMYVLDAAQHSVTSSYQKNVAPELEQCGLDQPAA